MVGEHHNLLHELLDQDALLFVGRFLPDHVQVEIREGRHDLLEPLREVVLVGVPVGSLGLLLLCCLELGEEPLLLLGEQFGADLLGVVQLEELAAVGVESGSGGAAVVCVRSRS